MSDIVDMLAERAQQGAALRKLHKDMESTLQVPAAVCCLTTLAAVRSRLLQELVAGNARAGLRLPGAANCT